MGTQLPLPQRGTALQFLAHICCGPTAGWIKMPLGMEVGLGRGLCVRWDQAPHSRKRGRSPNFRPMSIVAKRLYVSEYHLHGGRPQPRRHCVRWGQAPHSQKRGRSLPIFGPCLLWTNGWMDQDDIWHVGGPWSTPHCARWGPSSPSRKRGRSPNFRPMSIVAKRLYVSEYTLARR